MKLIIATIEFEELIAIYFNRSSIGTFFYGINVFAMFIRESVKFSISNGVRVIFCPATIDFGELP